MKKYVSKIFFCTLILLIIFLAIPVYAGTQYTITYKLNGGRNSTSNPSFYEKTTSTITLKAPNKTGYAFVGWYSDSGFTKPVTQIVKGSTGNKTLYAKWRTVKYSIRYNLNGGKNNSKNITTYNITTNTFTLLNPSRSGYAFVGWYSDSGLTKPVTQIVKGSTGNKTLYAKWRTVKYSIKYNLNGGKNNSKNITTYNITTNTFKLLEPTKSGYIFGGWYSDSTFKTKVTQIAKGSIGNKTLYAKWNKPAYTYSGTGSKNINTVNLPKGIWKAEIIHNGSGKFSAALNTISEGTKTLASTTGKYTGEALISNNNIGMADGYLKVVASGYWKISFKKVTSNVLEKPIVIGIGNTVTEYFLGDGTRKTLKYACDGQDFKVTLYNTKDSSYKVLVNKKGVESGSTTFYVGEGKVYYMVIQSSGKSYWGLQWK